MNTDPQPLLVPRSCASLLCFIKIVHANPRIIWSGKNIWTKQRRERSKPTTRPRARVGVAARARAKVEPGVGASASRSVDPGAGPDSDLRNDQKVVRDAAADPRRRRSAMGEHLPNHVRKQSPSQGVVVGDPSRGADQGQEGDHDQGQGKILIITSSLMT